MIDCPFTLNTDGLWQCPKCNWTYKKKSDKPPRRNCPALLTPEEKAKREAERQRQKTEALEDGAKLGWTTQDALHWMNALQQWRAAGYPTRTDGEVIAILEICQVCEEYKADEQRCRKCRCCVNDKHMAVFNKARMKTETCPLEKW